MGWVQTKLLTATTLFAGAVAPLAAQAPAGSSFAAQSFEVLPPRRLPMPRAQSPADSSLNTVGFFSPPTSSPPAPRSPAPPVSGPTSWLNAPRPASDPKANPPSGVTLMPLFGRPHAPPAAARPFTLAAAPAWRWHGYGSVSTQAGTESSGSTVGANSGLNVPVVSPPIVLPMPTALPPAPMPSGPALAPEPRPTSAPQPTYVPPSIDALPLPSGGGEPSWKPTDAHPVPAPVMPPSSVIGASFTSPARNRENETPAASFTPAAHAPPPPSDQPLVTLRSLIETTIAGRGRDFEMFFRNPNHLLVRLKVHKSADAEIVANQISRLPEMAPYHVVYEISVAP